MTHLTPEAATALEDARRTDGRFGRQQRSTPGVELAAPRPLDTVLSSLADAHARAAYRSESLARDARIESFIAQAQTAVPEATAAEFVWDYSDGATRLVFDRFVDADGAEVHDDGYPDILDFAFDDYKEARGCGFVETDHADSAVLTFADASVRDEATARRTLAVTELLQGQPDETGLNALLTTALRTTPAEQTAELTDADRDAVRDAFERAVGELRRHFAEQQR